MNHQLPNDLRTSLHEIYGIHVNEIKQLEGELDLNFFVRAKNGEFILKLAHEVHPLPHLQMENAAMSHLSGIQLRLPSVIVALDGREIVEIDRYHARLLKWVSGKLFCDVNPVSERLLIDTGRKVGILHHALQGFSHPVLRRFFRWDVSQVKWVQEEIETIGFDHDQKELINDAFTHLNEAHLLKLNTFPRVPCYNDANDYNMIVNGSLDNPELIGFIDFGDLILTQRINELAITIAYAITSQPDPLMAACEVIRGFSEVVRLEENEIQLLYGQVLARWVVSVAHSTMRKDLKDANPYLSVSESGAWKMIAHWLEIHPGFAETCFRHACGWEPSKHNTGIVSFLKTHRNTFFPIYGSAIRDDRVTVFDWSIDSPELGNFDQFHDVKQATYQVFNRMANENTEIGIGRYDEPRPVYSTDEYAKQGNSGLEWRTVHLGIDLFMPAGTPLYAPLDGEVAICVDDAGDKEYGPLLVLKHTPDDGPTFYTLYGHNDPEVLERLHLGDQVKRGDRICLIGDYPENGNWVPHVHFQIITELFDFSDDFPGVAYPKQRAIWKSISPDPNLILGLQDDQLIHQAFSKVELSDRRRKVIGPNLSLSYRDPIYIQRGYLQYLYDDVGQKYLDTVNNVPHVGHQHPDVVRAGQNQLGILNTNTRYLHEKVVLYAEELLETLPDHLEVIYFVNSGSEANELALRIARSASGLDGILAMDHGYHGNTGGLVDLSAYKFNGPGGRGLMPGIDLVRAPDPYRDGHQESSEYAQYFIDAYDQLDAKLNCAAFIHESILSCGGQLVMPEGFFTSIYQEAKKRGVLMIADEVQTGLGRVGEAWWAFELHQIEPDIVTMGKPIGNGFPLGAVAVTRELAERFANGMEYFNTFGGNPLSCAIGLSVLHVVKAEQLRGHALMVGEMMKHEMTMLKTQFPILGDIRGNGLFLGFEFVEDPDLKTHATEKTRYAVNRMKEKGILTSDDGPKHNVIKFKPPMCFDTNNATRYIESLAEILREDMMQ